MVVATGFFNSSGSPCLNIHLGGTFTQSGELGGIEFEAVIDTGFAGFISMPLTQAFPLGLPLSGLVNVTLADGSISEKFTASGRATVANRTRWGRHHRRTRRAAL
jgi:predicted aspartyl protease